RRQQQEDQIHRLTIERVEIDRLFQTREYPHEATEAHELSVRNSNALTDAGGAQPLAVEERVETFTLIAPAKLGRARGELLQRLFLGLHFQRRQNRVRGEQIG